MYPGSWDGQTLFVIFFENPSSSSLIGEVRELWQLQGSPRIPDRTRDCGQRLPFRTHFRRSVRRPHAFLRSGSVPTIPRKPTRIRASLPPGAVIPFAVVRREERSPLPPRPQPPSDRPGGGRGRGEPFSSHRGIAASGKAASRRDFRQTVHARGPMAFLISGLGRDSS